MNKNSQVRLDFIGDIHGQATPLKRLLQTLGYEETVGVWRHPRSQAVFCGDILDRGREILETVRIVRTMVEDGAAHFILGNHEWNALRYFYEGQCLRERGGRISRGESLWQDTARQLEVIPGFLEASMRWLLDQPLWLDFDQVRAVHAAWHDRAIEIVGQNRFSNSDFFRATLAKGTLERAAVRVLLKGIQFTLPSSIATSRSARSGDREKIRTAWWRTPKGLSYHDLCFPPRPGLPCDLGPTEAETRHFPGYSAAAPPVFFGHYHLPPQRPSAFGNVVCLDHTGGTNSFLTAYSWNGEYPLDDQRFVTSSNEWNKIINSTFS